MIYIVVVLAIILAVLINNPPDQRTNDEMYEIDLMDSDGGEPWMPYSE